MSHILDFDTESHCSRQDTWTCACDPTQLHGDTVLSFFSSKQHKYNDE